MTFRSTCALVLLLAAGGARAEVIPAPRGTSPAFDAPLRVKLGSGRLERPVWTHAGLVPAAETQVGGLAQVERPGLPTYDPSTRAWYAAANGALVRLPGDGRLPVLVAGAVVQGRDVELRVAAGVAVCREPEHSIVLLRFRQGQVTERRVLVQGPRFFRPRLAPDGTRLLVSESRSEGAHLWLMDLRGRGSPPADLGRADDATWHPDGRRVLYTRVAHDGHSVTGAELWELDLETLKRRPLTQTPHRAEVEPTVSPDGQWVAFVDAASGDLFVARYQR